ncbi:MAG: tetratricopeptide repeat protein [Myxococcaceae bacterium]|nr:tetratricopeptide repeat protein [Myxococcaceae bacterium]MCA3010852.1 tetratricopeptide repeat protein [Myxococcaceae bacterium]
MSRPSTQAPGAADAHDALTEGLSLLEQGRFEEAKGLFQQVTGRWPTMSEGFLALGLACLELGEDAGAERATARAIELAPTSGGARYRRAEVLARLGQFEACVQALGAAIELSPGEAAPYLALARIFETSGQTERALEVLSGGLTALPGEPQLLEEVGRLRG